MLRTHDDRNASICLDITVYSDGSRTGQGAGYGYAVYFGPTLLTQGYGPAGPQIEVYDAEIMGAVEGLRAAVQQEYTKYATRITIRLDNLAG